MVYLIIERNISTYEEDIPIKEEKIKEEKDLASSTVCTPSMSPTPASTETRKQSAKLRDLIPYEKKAC
jgi:hypothetical protein